MSYIIYAGFRCPSDNCIRVNMVFTANILIIFELIYQIYAGQKYIKPHTLKRQNKVEAILFQSAKK